MVSLQGEVGLGCPGNLYGSRLAQIFDPEVHGS